MKTVRRSIAIMPLIAALLFSITALENERQTESPVVIPVVAPAIIAPVSEEPIIAQEIIVSPPLPVPDNSDVELLAKLIWGEARGVPTKSEKAAVVWCVLNRVDDPRWPNTISEVVLQKGQFYGYEPNFPITDEHKEIAFEVVQSWLSGDEKDRVLPREYVFFTGDGKRNWFRSEYNGGAICNFKE